MRFIGRGRTMASPIALDGRSLTGTTGCGARSGGEPAPASAPRARRICQRMAFSTGAAETRDAAVTLAQRYHDRGGGGARGDDGLHPQPDAAPAPRHLERAGPPVRPPGLPGAVPRRVAAGRAGATCRNHAGAVGAVGARHLRRPADPARDGRGGRRSPAGAARPAGPGVLAGQGPASPTSSSSTSIRPTISTRCTESLSALIAGGSWGAWRDRPGGVFLLRADALSPADRALLDRRWRARCWRVVAANCPNSSTGRRRRRRRRAARSCDSRWHPRRMVPATDRRAAAADGQRPRRVHRGRPRVRHHARATIRTRRRRGRTSWPTRSSARWSRRPGASFTWSVNSREHRLTPFDNDPIVGRHVGGHLPARRRDRRDVGRHALADAAPARRRLAGAPRRRRDVVRTRHRGDCASASRCSCSPTRR